MRTLVETPVRPSGDVMRIVGASGASAPRRAAGADVKRATKTATIAVAGVDFMVNVGRAFGPGRQTHEPEGSEAISGPFYSRKRTAIRERYGRLRKVFSPGQEKQGG